MSHPTTLVLTNRCVDPLNPPWLTWHLLGVHQEVWGLVATIIAISLLGQLAVSSQASLQRERRLVRTAAELREASVELDRLARTDGLTGIANRRAFFEALGLEFRRSQRYGRELSVLMLDLDHFKQVNDRWGHPFGDYVLQHLASVVGHSIRESDLVGRYGGEEFAVLLPEMTSERAETLAEKLRQAVEAAEFRVDGLPRADEPVVRITISIGIASLSLEPDQDEFELMRRADQALYEANRTGRNRTGRNRTVVVSLGNWPTRLCSRLLYRSRPKQRQSPRSPRTAGDIRTSVRARSRVVHWGTDT